MSQKTIAIIGATGKTGTTLAKRLAASNYRLLLFDHGADKLDQLKKEIQALHLASEIEYMHCASEASWEADIIIPDVELADAAEIAEKIRPFSNRKIVMCFSNNDLQTKLPGATVVNILPTGWTNENGKEELVVENDNDEVYYVVADILEKAGFAPVSIKSINNFQINQSKINTMETTKWILDPTHSEIHFKVRHMMVSWVSGGFKKFDITVETDGDDIKSAKVRFNADIDSIFTNNDQRDAHLKNSDFFDAPNHPQLSFESTNLEKIDDENYKLSGKLTMRGVTKNVVLNAEYGGTTLDPWGNTRLGVTVTGKINRKEFGISYGAVSETGGVLLGEDVSINANAELIKQAALQTKAA